MIWGGVQSAVKRTKKEDRASSVTARGRERAHVGVGAPELLRVPRGGSAAAKGLRHIVRREPAMAERKLHLR